MRVGSGKALRALVGLAGIMMLNATIVSGGAIPRYIGYQGKLTNTSGQPLTGNYDFTFSLYTDFSAIIATWTETQPGITVANGLYSVVLGTVQPLSLAFDAQYWMEIKVDNETLSPREMLKTSPYAMRSEYSNSAATAAYAVTAVTATYVLVAPGVTDRASNLEGGGPNQLVYQETPSRTGFIAAGSAGQVLKYGNPPAWGSQSNMNVGYSVGAGTAASIAGGGANQIPVQTGANTTGFLGTGNAGQVLASNGAASAPAWNNISALSVGYAVGAGTAASIAGGGPNQLHIQTGLNTSGFIGAGNAGQVLTSNGAGSAPTWNNSAGYAVGAGTAASIANGVANQIPYQTGPGATGFIGTGTADGQVLTWYDATGPRWDTAAGGSLANSGIVVLINVPPDENEVSGTGNNNNAKSYVVPAGLPYRYIMAESEVGIVENDSGQANQDITCTFGYSIAGGNTLTLKAQGNNAADSHYIGSVLKNTYEYQTAYSATGVTITVQVTGVTNSSALYNQWKVKSLRVYGIY